MLTDCNSGTVQKLAFGVSTTIQLKNVTTASDSNVISAGHKCAGTAHVVATFFSSIVVLSPKGNFWIKPLWHSVSDVMISPLNTKRNYF